MTKPTLLEALFGSQRVRPESPTTPRRTEHQRAYDAAILERLEQECAQVEDRLTRERIERDEALHKGDDEQ